MTCKNFWKKFAGKMAVAAVLPLLCLAAAVPAFAQTAEIRSTGVYYIDGQYLPAVTAATGSTLQATDINSIYCNWGADNIKAAENYYAYKGGTVNVDGMNTSDPWQTSALIEYDQPYPSPNIDNSYPNHCLALCMDVYCTNKPNGATTYSIAFPIQSIMFEIAKYRNGADISNAETNPAIRTIFQSILDNNIEDEGSASTGSSSQDLAKYMCASYSCLGATSNPENSCTCPNPEYECIYAKDLDTKPCEYLEDNYCCRSLTNPQGNGSVSSGIETYTFTTSVCNGAYEAGKGNCGSNSDGVNFGGETNCIVRAEGTGRGYNDPIRFCTSWDGSYEILGEFGKTNGQFGFRATIKTEYPGDGIAIENISIDQTYPYPGNNQYPIQVDVSNVHTVRSTPSVVGSITSVQALPYSLAYRLSKDSDVLIQLFDASAQVPVTNQGSGNMTNSDAELVLEQNAVVRTLVNWEGRLGEGLQGSTSDKAVVESDSWDGRDDSGRLLPANNYLVSIQAKSQDEWPGTDFSRAVTRQLSVDPLKLTDIEVQGLNKQSTAYATVRYVPTESSTVYFEVYSPGTTFEGLEPLGYQPTGTSPVISNNSGTLVYRSQQQRGRSQSYPDKWDGLCHNDNNCAVPYAVGSKLPISGDILTADNGATVCTTANQNGAAAAWDAATNVCTITYANGSPLPDGDYIYVLWAEVPYTDLYFNGAACYQCELNGQHMPAGCGITWNNDFSIFTCETGTASLSSSSVAAVLSGTFTGVKTQKYYTGILPVERGVVDITIQPVSYSTIGSSPTAYGLDPFIFKYSVAREATVEAEVQNTAGVTVKTLTDEGGNTNVAQQMNTLSWDGRDDQGRIVGPGTYMFVVKTKDPMFPESIQTTASAIFPVDLYRVVDVSTTDVYGDSGAKATINYTLSKAMNVQINIYNKDVVIPLYTDTGESTVETFTTVPAGLITALGVMSTNPLPNLVAGSAVPVAVAGAPLVEGDVVGYSYIYTEPVLAGGNTSYTYYRVKKQVTALTATTEDYTVLEVLQYTVPVTSWPPRVCDQDTDAAVFTNGYVDPAKNPQCIYVNDTTFTNYPANAETAKYNYAEGATQTLDVRLQPVKTFNRSSLKAGEGVSQTEEWDAQYFYNPTPVSTLDGGKNTPEAVEACAGQTDKTACPYEMIPDGTYPFYISAQTEEPVNLYYDSATAQPVRTAADVTAQTGLYATDKATYRVNITRGPVYFLDGSVAVYPNAPQLFNTSSGPVFVPPYEINFAISRAATVEVAIVALEDGLCTSTDTPAVTGDPNVQMARAGDVCKYLSTMTIVNTPNFDPNVIRKLYWDGTDNNGYYVRNGNYEIRLTAKNYPDEGLYEPTVKQLTQNVDLLKVFDLPETEAYALNKRGTNISISYQISVPMKVAIQIFKPGTTIYDYQKGTLRDPATGKEVTDIHDVLVRAIVGIRPATTLIEEIWDGTDYAQQDVPDGTYPFRFVTALQSANIDSITGEILNSDDQSADPTQWSIEKVADTNQYVNLHRATVAIGDGEFVCEDWEKTVFFYPNPFKTPTGTMEITKLPVPGKMSFKLYNLAGDLVRESGYTCVDANNMSVVMGSSIDLSPDNNVSTTVYDPTVPGNMPNVRNAALRCFWDRTNQHGKKVARGVYFGLVDFRAQNGRQHCQKVVKILIPR